MKAEKFLVLGRRVREDLSRHEDVDGSSEERTRRRLLSSRVATERHRRPSYRVGAGLAAAVALAAALVIWSVWRPASQRALSFWVEDRAGHVDEWITARQTEQSLRFSDGSSIVASPRTTTRVLRVAPDGAQLTLERGHLNAHVVHRETSRWQVSAGPFVVHVTGTRFQMGWDPQAEKLSVSVSEGRVEVSGGGHPRHELVAGSSLELALRAETAPSAQAVGATPPPADEPADESASGSTHDEEAPSVPRKTIEPKDFRTLSTAGNYREALALVELRGFAAECERLSARDLLTLGSTARLAGRSDRAKQAYSAVRRRFPGGSEASISAFSLGRLASDAGHASDAVTWFRRYLSEQPSGALAREAAGRLLELLKQSGQDAAAREAATLYLKQYPGGPHAALARSVLAHR